VYKKTHLILSEEFFILVKWRQDHSGGLKSFQS